MLGYEALMIVLFCGNFALARVCDELHRAHVAVNSFWVKRLLLWWRSGMEVRMYVALVTVGIFLLW